MSQRAALPAMPALLLLVASVLASTASGAWPLPGASQLPATRSAIPIASTPVPIVGPFVPPNCAVAPLAGTAVCDESLPLPARVAGFVASLTTAEKMQCLADHWASVDRVGLPYYLLVNEGLHGVVFGGASAGLPCSNGTQFPQTILSSASFDRDLIRLMASTISTEQRALSNVGYMSMGILSPQINLVRDPRWGRGMETPGEDPYHIGQFGIAFTQGIEQGDDPRYSKVMSVGKHYFGYDLEGWGNSTRFSFNAVISTQDIVETMLPPWQAAIQTGGMSGFMCSYTAINGEPSCAAGDWMNGLARGRWGMPGLVVSDCAAIEMLADPTGHHYVNSSDATMTVAMRGGCDVPCGNYYQLHGPQALANGAINATDVDIAFTRVINALVRLGWFDDPFKQPYKYYNCSHVSSAQNQQLAYQVAAAGLTLLKNQAGLLPLTLSAVKTIAVIGPNSDSLLAYLGNYAGTPPYLHTLVYGLKRYSSLQIVNISTEIYGGTNDPTVMAAAVSAAKAADLTIFVGGLDSWREGEGNDRHNISLPQCQSTIHALLEQASSKPIIAVILSGSSLDLSYMRDSPRTGAIVWGGYAGQDGGSAIADLLFGAFSPAGRLPITFYPDVYVNQVAMDDMQMRPHGTSLGRTYKFYTGTPVFPFGFGLSYTVFSYQWTPSVEADSTLAVDALWTAAGRSEDGLEAQVVSYSVTVTNTGSVTSDVSVLGFISTSLSTAANCSALASAFSPPLAQLFDYQRVHSLAPGRSASLVLTVSLSTLTQVDQSGDRWLVPATHTVWIGTSDRQQAHLTHSFNTEGSGQMVQLNPLTDIQRNKQEQRTEIASALNRAVRAASE